MSLDNFLQRFHAMSMNNGLDMDTLFSNCIKCLAMKQKVGTQGMNIYTEAGGNFF